MSSGQPLNVGCADTCTSLPCVIRLPEVVVNAGSQQGSEDMCKFVCRI